MPRIRHIGEEPADRLDARGRLPCRRSSSRIGAREPFWGSETLMSRKRMATLRRVKSAHDLSEKIMAFRSLALPSYFHPPPSAL